MVTAMKPSAMCQFPRICLRSVCGPLVCVIQGGLKAVLWADTVQMFIMMAGILAILIKGCITLGGIGNVWAMAEQGGRINFNKWVFIGLFPYILL